MRPGSAPPRRGLATGGVRDVLSGSGPDRDCGAPQACVGSEDSVAAVSLDAWGGKSRARRWSSSRGVRRSARRPCTLGSGIR